MNITVHASVKSPFTNGIFPDSCSNLCIEGCNIEVGHDAIALKSGRDNYGVTFGTPSTDIHLSVPLSPLAVRLYVEHLHIDNSLISINFKTVPGRGGFVHNIVISNVEMENVREAFQFSGNCGRHPDFYSLVVNLYC